MKTISVWLGLVSLLVSLSCQTSSDLEFAAGTNFEGKHSQSEALAYERTSDEIQKMALDVATVLRSSDGLRSSKPLSVASMFALPNESDLRNTSTSNANPKVVEFSDNEGYAIVSENTAGAEVLYVADNGRFDKAFYSENLAPRISGYVSRWEYRCRICNEIGSCAPENCIRSIPQFECEYGCRSQKECTHEPIAEGIVWIPDLLRGKNNLLKTNWHLGSPFNIFAPVVKYKEEGVITEGRAAIGCNTVAILQIMAYHQSPVVLGGNIIPWRKYRMMDDFEGADSIIIAKAAKYVADEIKSTYGISNTIHTSASSRDVKKFMLKVGYKDYTDQPYNIDAVMNELDQNRPMFITAYKKSGGGHIWILDGYKKMQYFKLTSKGKIKKSYDFVHCNWGWGKVANQGYFLSEVFHIDNLEHKDIERKYPNFLRVTDGEPFIEDCRIYTGIEPKHRIITIGQL